MDIGLNWPTAQQLSQEKRYVNIISEFFRKQKGERRGEEEGRENAFEVTVLSI